MNYWRNARKVNKFNYNMWHGFFIHHFIPFHIILLLAASFMLYMISFSCPLWYLLFFYLTLGQFYSIHKFLFPYTSLSPLISMSILSLFSISFTGFPSLSFLSKKANLKFYSIVPLISLPAWFAWSLTSLFSVCC